MDLRDLEAVRAPERVEHEHGVRDGHVLEKRDPLLERAEDLPPCRLVRGLVGGGQRGEKTIGDMPGGAPRHFWLQL